MPEPPPGFMAIASSGQVVRSSLKVALVVGTLLAAINHGGAIVDLSLSGDRALQVLLTYLVPYGVSTYSAVRAVQKHPGYRA